MNKEEKAALTERHAKHIEDNWTPLNWRAWGSWFSWGSPIGLALFYAIIILSTGAFLWLIHQY